MHPVGWKLATSTATLSNINTFIGYHLLSISFIFYLWLLPRNPWFIFKSRLNFFLIKNIIALFWLFVLFWGQSHLAVISSYSWLCDKKSLMAGQGTICDARDWTSVMPRLALPCAGQKALLSVLLLWPFYRVFKN